MLTSAGTNRHSSVYYVHLHGVVRKSRASKTIGHVLIALPYFHLCAERPSSGNEAKPLWALKMWHLSHVSDIHCSKIFPASSWQRWWILASVWIQLACRSEALGSFFFFSFFFLFLLTAYLCGANKMWHHAAFCSSHSLEANQICVKHDMKWRGGGSKVGQLQPHCCCRLLTRAGAAWSFSQAGLTDSLTVSSDQSSKTHTRRMCFSCANSSTPLVPELPLWLANGTAN